MSGYDQNQPQVVDSAPAIAEGSYVAPTPGDKPIKDCQGYPQGVPPKGYDKARGDGFWRGFCSGICCNCCLDMCF